MIYSFGRRRLSFLPGVKENRADWLKNASGLSRTSRRMRASSWPRDRISKINSGTAKGSLWPRVARRIDEDALGPIELDHIRGAGGGAFGDRIERHPDPVACIESGANRVLLDVVNTNTLGLDPAVSLNISRIMRVPLILIGEMRGMDQDQFVGLERRGRGVPGRRWLRSWCSC